MPEWWASQFPLMGGFDPKRDILKRKANNIIRVFVFSLELQESLHLLFSRKDLFIIHSKIRHKTSHYKD